VRFKVICIVGLKLAVTKSGRMIAYLCEYCTVWIFLKAHTVLVGQARVRETWLYVREQYYK